jgi:hypothetical protein
LASEIAKCAGMKYKKFTKILFGWVYKIAGSGADLEFVEKLNKVSFKKLSKYKSRNFLLSFSTC